MQATVTERKLMNVDLAASVFGDRGAQFVDRLEWDLCVTPEGLETDEYDDDGAQYLVIHDGGDHLGSCRVRPVAAGTMIEDHFLDLFPDAAAFMASQAGCLYELTRFCRSPDIPVRRSAEVMDELAVLLDTFRDDNNITGFVAVTYPSVGRFLKRIGVRFLVLGESVLDGRRIQMICLTHAVAASRLSEEFGNELTARWSLAPVFAPSTHIPDWSRQPTARAA